METNQTGATIFETFFSHWSRRVARERFREDLVDLMAGAIGGLATALLDEDKQGWFKDEGTRQAAILGALDTTLDEITIRLGPDMSLWKWGDAHRIRLRHVLSGRGDLGQLLDRGGQPISGDGITVCNTGYDPNWGALVGATYRLIVDLSESPPGLWAVDAQGESGHPGSAHYCDQLIEWMSARYHHLPLDRDSMSAGAQTRLTLQPNV